VLGEKHVNRSLENLNDFNSDFQNFISRFAWGEVWSRPGIPRHTRSLVTIGILLALGREAELRMHLRACFNNGVTKDELKELFSLFIVCRFTRSKCRHAYGRRSF
jgi:4-carboxymuconolactone decarboxylase